MIRFFLRSRIDGATVTGANLTRAGSIVIDRYLMNAAELMPYEKVEVCNETTGARFETVVVDGPAGSGEVCINGAAAHLAKAGDKVSVACYCGLHAGQSIDHKPRLVSVDDANRVVALKEDEAPETSPA